VSEQGLYEVRLAPRAEKDLKKLQKRVLKQVLADIRELAKNPRPPGAIKLEDEEGLYRLRCGDIRVIYCIESKVLVVTVVRVGDRKNVYKKDLGK